MKNLFFFSIIIILFSCEPNNSEEIQYNEPKKVIVTGKVVNPNPENENIWISINRIGFEPESHKMALDDQGGFKTSFEIYIPVDIGITYHYGSNFCVIAHPGDSVHIEFDGSALDRPDIFQTIKFSGNRVTINQQVTAFQKRYYESDLHTDKARLDSAAKHYNQEQYKLFADTVRKEGHQILQDFIVLNSSDEEVNNWARLFLEEKYYYMLYAYPGFHSHLRNLNYGELEISNSYYDYLKEIPSLQNSLVNGSAIHGLTNQYLNRYLWQFVVKIITASFDEETPLYLLDSVHLASIVKHTPDILFRQIVMTEFFSSKLKGMNVEVFDRNMGILKETIREPFLLKPLLQEYNTVDSILTHSKLEEGVVVNDRVKFSKDFLPTLIDKNKGKVVYIDIWATWCGPCLQEFKIAGEFQETMPDVAFIYLCIDSQEKFFNNVIKKFQLEGDHYYFGKEEGKMIREELGLNGVPHYLIINRKGEIVKTGSEIRPSNKSTREIIQTLL